jgi:hypothetical protein
LNKILFCKFTKLILNGYYNKEGYKAPKEKEMRNTNVSNVIIDEKIVQQQVFFCRMTFKNKTGC